MPITALERTTKYSPSRSPIGTVTKLSDAGEDEDGEAAVRTPPYHCWKASRVLKWAISL